MHKVIDVRKVAVHVAVVVNVDGAPIEDRIDKLVKRQIGTAPRTVDGKEPEHRCRKIIEVRIGMAHALVRLLGGRIDGQLRVGLFRLDKRHFGVGAIHRGC